MSDFNMKCSRCGIRPVSRKWVDRDIGVLVHEIPLCRLFNSCLFLDAVECGHPFVEALTPDGQYCIVRDRYDRGVEYIREELPYQYSIIG